MTETTGRRERSTIKFPYGDLDDATAIARTIHDQHGRSCALDQLAAGMGQSISGAFRGKVATASTFGVIETARKEVTLTDLGVRIVDPQTTAAARVEAFLGVPLYRAVFDEFRGSRLPAKAGLEAEMVRLGVSAKQAGNARQALQRSADQAGFFHAGRDRLVQPPVGTIGSVQTATPGTAAEADAALPITPSGGVDSWRPSGHPLLVGLWQELPDPKVAKLDPEKQAQWIETAKVVLKLLYGGAATGVVAPVPESQGPRRAKAGSAGT